MSKYPANDLKFQLVRDLNLPAGQYAITSSGPIGVREIREIGDIDLVVDDDLWSELASAYPIIQEQGVTKIRISRDIEVLAEALKRATADGHARRPAQSAVVLSKGSGSAARPYW